MAAALEHPLTEAQSGLWFAQRLDPANPIFNTAHYLDIRGDLDVEAFRAAVDRTAAEAEAATRPLAGLTARHLMSRDLVTVAPSDSLPTLAAAFHRHRFKTLPMVREGRYLGLVAEEALVGVSDPILTAGALAHPAAPASPDTPAAELVQRLADGREQALPIVENGHLVGLVTRSDLIALLARPLSGDPDAQRL